MFDQECETAPMCHALLRDASFWRFLQLIDHDLAEQESAGGCPACGAPLHRADYPRKPRGVPRALFGPDGVRRLSFCCARDGCRRRMTPSSVRFLGRRVFAGAVVVLACALAQGLSERRRQRLCERIGVGLRTLERWRRWWQRDFAASAPWAAIRSRLATPVEEQALPHGLLERMTLRIQSMLWPTAREVRWASEIFCRSSCRLKLSASARKFV